jgi:hypothetical protein
MQKLPLPTQTLYAELLEQLMALEAHRSIGHLAGSFVTKEIKGARYFYFQYSQPGGTLKQIYLGKADPVLQKVLLRLEQERPKVQEEQAQIHRLCAQLRAGGALTTDSASGRVLKALADGGLFKLGGLLVGTHAFAVLGNLLGYAWRSPGLKTQDVDIAADPILKVAVPEISADVPKILESLEMGFLPVPPFNPKHPSTSYMIRGKALRVDLLTPSTQPGKVKPIPIGRWKTFAQPVPYLNYLLKDIGPGAVINGGGILVNVPSPARYALHKLITSQERPHAFHTKVQKDQQQAGQILQVLVAERPGDLDEAWKELKSRGPGWIKRVKASLPGLKSTLAKEHFNQIQKIFY